MTNTEEKRISIGRLASLLSGDLESRSGTNGQAGFQIFLTALDRSFPLHRESRSTDDVITFASADKSLRVSYVVKQADSYVALSLISVTGWSYGPGWELRFEICGDESLRATELGYMPNLSGQRGRIQVCWDDPGHDDPADAPGGAAFYLADSDDEEDGILLDIWAAEDLPRPGVTGEWTRERAHIWLEEWIAKFSDRSQMILEGRSLDELRECLPVAKAAAIREIYLFTNTWRPDPFWPLTGGNVEVNRRVFPRGEEDLRAFSEELAADGMRLNLHYVSGGIGFLDPIYVGSRPDRRLASWGTCQLCAPVQADETTLRLQPARGLVWPPVPRRHFFRCELVRIGDELIRLRSGEVQPDGSWVLKDCERGLFKTVATRHAEGTDVKGLVTAYGENFVPDNSSTLLDEIADGYAGLLNRCQIGHAEYDGAEIHAWNGRWGFRKFATRVYEQLDHAVTVHDSSGQAPRYCPEYRFHSVRRVFQGSCLFSHGNWSVPIQPASPSRPASTLLDAHFVLTQGNAGGAMGMCRPEPMFGVNPQALRTHGLTGEFTKALLAWKAVSRQLSPGQRQLIENTYSAPACPMPESSHHRASQVVLRAESTDAGALQVSPVHVLTRKSGDIAWRIGQEHGPLSPRQFVKPGQTLELENPCAPQPVQFMIRVLRAFDRDAECCPPPAISNRPTKVFGEEDFFVAGNQPRQVAELVPGTPNYDLLSGAPDSCRAFPTRWEKTSGGVMLEAGAHSEDRWETKDMPTWECVVDLSRHRGMGFLVHGDKSGACLLFQIEGDGRRDFVVPLDFEGPRYVEIPHGEVSWAMEQWGWRMETKSIDYSRVRRLKLGFGYIPAGQRPRIRLERLMALAEISARLEDPVIEAGGGKLRVQGNIENGQILSYTGGGTATVFDRNWNRVAVLPVEPIDFVLPTGFQTFVIRSSGVGPQPWLESQFLALEDPILSLSL